MPHKGTLGGLFLTIRPTPVGAGLPAMASTRFGWQPAASASQASQLLQGMRRSHHSTLSCGSVLARDGINAVWLKDRSVSIAGKPAPTGYAALAPFGTFRWERACPRWHQRGLAGRPQRLQANQWLCGKCSNRVLHTPAICSSSNLTASSTSPARQASRISRCSWSARCLPADKLICMRR